MTRAASWEPCDGTASGTERAAYMVYFPSGGQLALCAHHAAHAPGGSVIVPLSPDYFETPDLSFTTWLAPKHELVPRSELTELAATRPDFTTLDNGATTS